MSIEVDIHRAHQVLICGTAGGLASIVTDLIYFPLDSIKTRLQASDKRVDYAEKAKNVSKYRGVVPTIIVSFPGAFTFFSVYEKSKKILKSIIQDGPHNHLVAASFGEIASNLVRNPFEVVKQQMQIGLNHTMYDTSKYILFHEGLVGFYAGLGSVLMRDIPFSALQFTAYEYLKKKAKERNHGQPLSLIQNSINGLFAAALASFCTTPIDVAKTKLMTQRDNYYSGMCDCLSKTWQEGGIRKLFSAAHIRVFNISLGGMIFFSSYEKFRHMLEKVYDKYQGQTIEFSPLIF